MKRKKSRHILVLLMLNMHTIPKKHGNNTSGEKYPVSLQAVPQHSALTNISAFPKDFLFTLRG